MGILTPALLASISMAETAIDSSKTAKVDLLGKALEIGKQMGALAGLGGHEIATIIGCEKAGLQPDFYRKTLKSKNYWSAALEPRNDSVWEETPQQTIEFMKTVKKSWIAYKVLGAGAIPPKEGFRYVFENGADFVCVGMFDFQVVEDVSIARDILATKSSRNRQWIPSVDGMTHGKVGGQCPRGFTGPSSCPARCGRRAWRNWLTRNERVRAYPKTGSAARCAFY